MSPRVTPVPGTPAVQQMLPPPAPQYPQSGRGSALYPTGRIPVTPPAIAGLGGLPAPQPLCSKH
eukprot:1005827-Amphidinium_carterae.1